MNRAPPIVPAEQPPAAVVPAHQVPVQAPRVIDPAAAVPPHQPPPQDIFYQPQPLQPQPPRPITEMLGTGSFFFLQVTFLFIISLLFCCQTSNILW